MDSLRFDMDGLFKACRLLFGEGVHLNLQFLEYIQEPGVKTAFRQKALLTHPDRLLHLNPQDRQNKQSLFIEVNSAYQELMEFLRARQDKRAEVIGARSRIIRPQDMADRPIDRFYKGQLPKRELRFAEFLYYSGRVPWKAFIDAIVWQRQQRPRFGEIARNWRYISNRQTWELLRNRTLGERIGETAIRLAYLTRLQVGTIVLHQQVRQRKIGEFFQLEGFLTREEIRDLYLQFRRHNIRYQARRFFE